MAITQDSDTSTSQANTVPNNPPNSSPSSISPLLPDPPPPPYDYQDHDFTVVADYESASTQHEFILPPITTKISSKKWWRRNWLKKGWRKLEKGAEKFNDMVLYAMSGNEIREIMQRMRREEWERKHRRA
jgi:hypothetical protein